MNPVEAKGDLSHDIFEREKRNRRTLGRRATGAAALAFATTMLPGVGAAKDSHDDDAGSLPASSAVEMHNSPPISSERVLFESLMPEPILTSNQSLDINIDIEDSPDSMASHSLVFGPEPNLTSEINLIPELTAEPAPEPTKETKPELKDASAAVEKKNKFTRRNFFREKGYVHQPNYETCAAATSFEELNSIRLRGIGGPEFKWRFSVSNSHLYAARRWMRENDTLDKSGVGTDPNGWVKFLNKMWGGEEVFRIKTEPKRYLAMIHMVRAMERTHYPAGLFVAGGAHAASVVGYGTRVDPLSRGFGMKDIEYLLVSDPLGPKIKKVTLGEFLNGNYFLKYNQRDSHRWVNGRRIDEYKKWYGQYTFIAPNPKVVARMRHQK